MLHNTPFISREYELTECYTGNALKYTKKGIVDIELNAADMPADPRSSNRGSITLKVTDSGIGMSQSFMSNDMYRPFKQADVHSSGTGLGLSIVKQIASELCADLDIQSQLGKGTGVSLTFTADFKDDVPSRGSSNAQPSPSFAGLNEEHVHFLPPDSSLRPGNSTLAAALLNSVQRTAAHWLGCKTSEGQAENLRSGLWPTFVVFAECRLRHLNAVEPRSLHAFMTTAAEMNTKVLVLAGSINGESSLSFEGFVSKPTLIAQPIGPRKLLRAMTSVEAVERPPLGTSNAGVDMPIVVRPGYGDTSNLNLYPTNQDDPLSLKSEGSRLSLSPSQRPVLPRQQTLAATVRPGKELAAVSPVSGYNTDSNEVSPNRPPTGAQSLHKSVLLVEDNSINMRLLIALVNKLKIPHRCASNGLEALQRYSAQPDEFFLVLMDIDMPVMNGIASTIKIREFERKQELKRTLIVALTGVTSKESMNHCLASGMDRFFTKPIQMRELSELISEVQELEE